MESTTSPQDGRTDDEQGDGVYRQTHEDDERLEDLPGNTYIKVIEGVAGGGKSTEGEGDVTDAVRNGTPASNCLIISFTRSETNDRLADFQSALDDDDNDEVPTGFVEYGDHEDSGATIRTFNSLSYHLAVKNGMNFDQVIMATDSRHTQFFRDFFEEYAPTFQFVHSTKEPLEMIEQDADNDTPLGNQFIAAYNYIRGQGYTTFTPDLIRDLDIDIEAPAEMVCDLMYDWQRYKFDNGLVQHDDYVHHALFHGLVPEEYTHLLVDEFQDLSPLQYGVYKVWRDSGQFERITIMGDPAQTIYATFRGTNPIYIKETPRHETVTITNSKRCAKSIMKTAAPLVEGEYDKQIGSNPYRKNEDGEWEQVDEEGSVNHHFAQDDEFLTVAMQAAVDKYVENDQSVMCLGRTNRDVGKMARQFNSAGIPYSPLSDASAEEKRGLWYWEEPMSSILRVLRAYRDGTPTILQQTTVPSFRLEKGESDYRPLTVLLSHYLPSHSVGRDYAEAARERTMCKQIRTLRLPGVEHVTELIEGEMTGVEWDFLDFVFDGDDLEQIINDLDLVSERKEILLNCLQSDHDATPQDIRIGTIHASKGMQSDCVFLLSGYSKSQYERFVQNPKVREEEKRLFYVGCTRARTGLNIIHNWNGSESFPLLR